MNERPLPASGEVSKRPSQATRSLKTSRQFTEVFRRGRRARSGGVTVVARRRRSGCSRVGLAVGRRVGGAAVRNRAKRRIRAAVRQTSLPTPFDFVIVAEPAVVQAPFTELCVWVQSATTRAVSRLAAS